MKGPKPVWMLATNMLNQSSPRPAATVPAGWGLAGRLGSAVVGIHSLLAVRGRCGWRGWHGGDRRCHQRFRLCGVLVFRRRLQFLLTRNQGQRFLCVIRIDPQQRPIDRNAAVADTEEAAEFDDGDTHAAAVV